MKPIPEARECVKDSAENSFKECKLRVEAKKEKHEEEDDAPGQNKMGERQGWIFVPKNCELSVCHYRVFLKSSGVLNQARGFLFTLGKGCLETSSPKLRAGQVWKSFWVGNKGKSLRTNIVENPTNTSKYFLPALLLPQSPQAPQAHRQSYPRWQRSQWRQGCWCWTGLHFNYSWWSKVVWEIWPHLVKKSTRETMCASMWTGAVNLIKYVSE